MSTIAELIADKPIGSVNHEPKPTKIVYEWIVGSGGSWLISEYLVTEEEAKRFWPHTDHRKTGREFEVPV